MISQHFRIRASSRSKISTSTGLTHNQFWTMRKHQYRRMGQNPKSPVWTVNKSGKREGPLPKTYAETLLNLQRKHRPSNVKDKLSTGAITYLNKWVQDFMYQRKNYFTSGPTSKGTRKENKAIELTREYLQDPFFPKKNEWRVVGEYSEGECDIRYGRTWDAKVAYTHEQMDFISNEAIRAYEEQVSEYNYLFLTNGGAITRVLCNMPSDMILSKAYSQVKASKGPDFTEDQLNEVIDRLTRNHTYDDLPIEMRVHTKTFDCNPNAEEETKQLVLLCREYIEQRFKEYPEHVQAAALAYIKMRKERSHWADVKGTQERAKAWQEEHYPTTHESITLILPETAQSERA